MNEVQRDQLWTAWAEIYLMVFMFFKLWFVMQSSYWSVWAYGDAQMLNAGVNFVQDGFLQHRFLPLVNPGFLHDLIPNNAPFGRYSHYPAIHSWILGVVRHYFKNQEWYFTAAKVVFTLFSLVALVAYFKFNRLMFRSARVAFFSVVILSLTPVFNGFSASLCDQSLGLLLSILLFYQMYALGFAEARKKGSFLGLASLFLVSLLSSLNSIEYIPIVSVLSVLCYIYRRDKWPFFAVSLGTGLGVVLHFAQILWAFGSYQDMQAHFNHLLSHRVRFGAFYFTLLEGLVQRVPSILVLLALCILPLFKPFKHSMRLDSRNLPNGVVFSYFLTLSASSFFLVFPQQSFYMLDYSYRHLLVPLIPLLVYFLNLSLTSLRQSAIEPVPIGSSVRPAIYFSAVGLVLVFGIAGLSWNSVSELTGHGQLDSSFHWAIDLKQGKNLVELKGPLIWAQDYSAKGDFLIVSDAVKGNSELEVLPVAEFFAQRHLLPSSFTRESLTKLKGEFASYKKRMHGVDPRVEGTRIFLLANREAIAPDAAGLITKINCYFTNPCVFSFNE